MDLIMEVANLLYLRKPLKILGYLWDNLFLAYSWDRQFWMGEFLLLLLFTSYTADKKIGKESAQNSIREFLVHLMCNWKMAIFMNAGSKLN